MKTRSVPALVAIVSLLAFSPGSSAVPSPFSPLGVFSNVRHTAEHAYGYSVQLWHTGDTLCGLFLAADGLAGDTPAGLLEDVEYDRRTGQLSFTSRLSLGLTHAGNVWMPSRDLFKFDGTLSAKNITGTLRHYDLLHADVEPQVKTLQLQIVSDEQLLQANTYEGWQRAVEMILKRQGPKW